MEKKEFELTEDQLKQIRIDKESTELNVFRGELQLERLKKLRDTNFMKRQAEYGIKKMEGMIENKKDMDDKDLDEFQIEDMKLQLEIRKKELEADIQKRELELSILKNSKELDRLKQNISVYEKQLRTKKFTQRQ